MTEQKKRGRPKNKEKSIRILVPKSKVIFFKYLLSLPEKAFLEIKQFIKERL